ncbi:ribosome biogenesis protein SLX9-domain-containing protein [Syncephalastrum racemosum]|uniref:Ribosome biogenesis protein SLX9 n=1 Tax=Syncephalastrum racemosum TaxID=13706 RepID=A0A1X2H4M5_SYNRA|nr:ribosome biogenesis protein SLX9-domain-containing protein [Syncephalastrum racemosum]
MPKIDRAKERRSARKTFSSNKPVDHDIPTIPSKDQKRKERHEAFMQKLSTTYKTKKKTKKGHLRADLSEFNDLLNNIVPDEDSTRDQSKPNTSIKSTPTSNKSRRKQELQEIVRFQKVMQLQAFKQNPLAAIRQHVQNTHGKK